MKWSGGDRPTDCMQCADEARIPASRELVLLVQHDRLEALAKHTPALAARHKELHRNTVDLSAEHFDRLGRVDLHLVGMIAEAQSVSKAEFQVHDRVHKEEAWQRRVVVVVEDWVSIGVHGSFRICNGLTVIRIRHR